MFFITVLYDLTCHKPLIKNHITPDHADDNIIQINILLNLSKLVTFGNEPITIGTTIAAP
uniref:Uncharacterized protein n=1 Tax=Escherichia coli TaxID=562 RepID=A0A288XG16_ECOLX|nr:hypothetical protein [Escherichia coli]